MATGLVSSHFLMLGSSPTLMTRAASRGLEDRGADSFRWSWNRLTNLEHFRLFLVILLLVKDLPQIQSIRF